MIKQPNIDSNKYKIDKDLLDSSEAPSNCTLSDTEVIKKVSNYINYLESKKTALQTFRNEDYKKEALSISPLWLWKEASENDLIFFKGLTSFDDRVKTLIIKIFNHENILISYKRRRFNGRKWVTASKTSPNKTSLKRVVDYSTPIYIVEGHHDALTATLLGINYISIPTVAYKTLNEHELQLLTNRNVVFLPDLGDKGKSIEGMHILADQILLITKSVYIADLNKIAHLGHIKNLPNKMDLSELVELWNQGLESFKKHLFEYSKRGEI